MAIRERLHEAQGEPVWEIAHLPLYTIWQEPLGRRAFAVRERGAGVADALAGGRLGQKREQRGAVVVPGQSGRAPPLAVPRAQSIV